MPVAVGRGPKGDTVTDSAGEVLVVCVVVPAKIAW
jgi:hypothetical protein